MGLFDSMFKSGGKYPASFVRSITQTAESLYIVVSESIQLASTSSDLEIKKSRLDYAMKKLVELIKLANEYPFLDFRRISMIYDQIREVRNEIKDMESGLQNPPELLNESIPEAGVPPLTGKPANFLSRDESKCPYCTFQFPVMPLRKGACPSCGKMIYVWYSTMQDMKKLITEDEAGRIEKDTVQHIEQYELLNKQETLNQSEDEVRKVQEELREKDPTATLDDAYLFLLNNKIRKSRKDGEKATLYFLKALMLDSAGKDFSKELYESKRFELLHLKSHEFVKNIQVITSSGCCRNCRPLSDRVVTIDEALEKMPLPHLDCENPLNGKKGFCRCSYLIVNR